MKLKASTLKKISEIEKSDRWCPSIEQELVMMAASGIRESWSYWGEDEGCDPTEKEKYISNLKELGFEVEEKQNRIYFRW